MAAAIVSDTVMFKSPTCTQRDIDIANRMSRIANVSLEELGQTIFSAATGEDKSAESIIRTDYKEFHIGGHNLAVSQITCHGFRSSYGPERGIPRHDGDHP